ncbi:MAG: D-aminoacyl-tRNA deacylase [Methylophagaceae bacterium]
MIALLQRVQHASVLASNVEIACINQGLLVFIGVEHGDTELESDKLLTRFLGYRIFNDQNDKMNLSIQDINGGLLLVPQFTLAANTQKGMRPSFTSAAPPELAETLFSYLCSQAIQQHPIVQTGLFGADMQVSLTNDGPVTFWLHTHPHNMKIK